MAFSGTGKVWMNGKIVDWADATIHIASHVIHYGSAVFEGARCYKTPKGSAFFRLDAHIRRLYDSAQIYRMDYELDRDAFTHGVVDTVKANGLEACYIRPIIYRGYNELGVNPLTCPGRRGHSRVGMGRVPRTGSARAGRRRLRELVGAERAEHVPGDGEVGGQLRQLRADQDGSGARRLQRGHRARSDRAASAKAAARTCSSCATTCSTRRRSAASVLPGHHARHRSSRSRRIWDIR